MTDAERFILSKVHPQLNASETIVHTGYLLGALELGGGGGIGRGVKAFAAAAKQRACFIALTDLRAFFLWSKPGRVGAFGPLLECDEVQVYQRAAIDGREERSGLLGKRLRLTLADGAEARFDLKRKVGALPDQARCIDALLQGRAAKEAP